MTPSPHATDLGGVVVIIPALNEAESLTALLPRLKKLDLGQVLVCDNGSTDDTRRITESHGALWVYEERRGYGAACFAGMQAMALDTHTVVFVDADQGEEVSMVADLVAPIACDECDLVIGARVRAMREPGATTLPQRFANWLLPTIIRIGWGHRFTDLGPFRAIRRSSLEAIDMKDRAFGWTIEMQIRAVELGLRIREVPVPHHRRTTGRSKITGTLRGVALAGYWIIRTCAALWLTRRRRLL